VSLPRPTPCMACRVSGPKYRSILMSAVAAAGIGCHSQARDSPLYRSRRQSPALPGLGMFSGGTSCVPSHRARGATSRLGRCQGSHNGPPGELFWVLSGGYVVSGRPRWWRCWHATSSCRVLSGHQVLTNRRCHVKLPIGRCFGSMGGSINAAIPI
jgi:hypothetical protein